MGKGSGARIKEIAQRLGLSAGTVSIVLNGRGDAMRISKATQQRVREAAKEMDYQPNIYARRLRTTGGEETARVIAVFWNSGYADDVMGRFFRGLHSTAQEKGYQVEFYVQLFEFGQLSLYRSLMTHQRFSGIIICGVSEQDAEFLNANEFDLPIVLLLRNERRYHCVYVEDYEVGKNVSRLFSQRGHLSAGLVGSLQKGQSATLRKLGFMEMCKRCGIEICEDWVQETEGRDYLSGYKAMKELLHSERKPEAIYVMAPEQVLGVLGACKEAGLSVPGDMEILAYGDSDAFDCFSPTVSSNYISMQEVAESALNLIILVIENDIDMPMSRILNAEYVFRESCGGFLEP